MTSPQGTPARREPLLWLQLLGLAAFPLELAALLLLLAGSDPGPLPGLERLFCWGLGGLGPAVLFWRLPPDLWSLLLVQVPIRARRADQLRLSALQDSLPLKLLSAAGALPLLPLLWWADNRAGLAWAWSPLAGSPRLLVLLAGAGLLMLLLWQWQQVVQALWMLSRPATTVAQTLPLSLDKAADRRLAIGLPLLLLSPLDPGDTSGAATVASAPATDGDLSEPEPEGDLNEQSESEPQQPADQEQAEEPDQEAAAPREQPTESAPEPEVNSVEPGSIGDTSSVPPEQGSEQAQGGDLDQQI